MIAPLPTRETFKSFARIVFVPTLTFVALGYTMQMFLPEHSSAPLFSRAHASLSSASPPIPGTSGSLYAR